jgi:uncharacterized protein (DUF1330 family)
LIAVLQFDILEIADPKKMEVYGHRIGPTIERYGGRYLVKAGGLKVVEGDWRPVLPVIIEYPSLEQAQRWYKSEDYQALRALRSGTAKLNAVFMEGAQ